MLKSKCMASGSSMHLQESVDAVFVQILRQHVFECEAIQDWDPSISSRHFQSFLHKRLKENL